MSDGDRLFFALLPDAAQADAVHAQALDLRGRLGLTSEPRGLSRYHLTLCFLGSVGSLPDDVERRAIQAAEQVQAACVDVMLDRLASFEGRARKSPLVLLAQPVGSLIQLRERLLVQLIKAQVPVHERAERGYTPHVTLFYDDQRVSPQATRPLHWHAGSFALVRSEAGLGRYVVLQRWYLRPN